MEEDNNWRTNKKKGEMRKDNWRSKDNYSKENRYFATTSGHANGDLKHRNPAKNPIDRSTRFDATTNRRNMSNPRVKVLNDIKSNNLLNPKFVNDLSTNQSTQEITTFLISNMDDYTQTLASEISDELLIALLKLGAKACENTFVTSKSYMLKSTLQQKFVSTICSFLSGLLVNDIKDSVFWQNFGNVLNSLLVILENAMLFIPITLWEYIQAIVKTVTLVLPVLQVNKTITLPEEFQIRIAVLQDNIRQIEKKFQKSEPTRNKNEDVTEDTEEYPEDDYRFIDLYPVSKELTVPERPYLRKNIVKGEYSSLHQYLDIHFRLMREDFLNPIREDMCDYLNNVKRTLFNIKIHNNVVFLKKEVKNNIICFEIKLDVSLALQNMIRTGQSKRLIHGTLLFFSDDNFVNLFCGKVVSNDELKNGILLINLPYENHDIKYQKKYSMIECVIFFEPYYQVLKVLQQLCQNQLPMEKYFLKVATNISHPKYMENVRDLTLPAGLNPSQIDAFNAALNKEFVIIQGPPGTGKTFLGITLTKMLLDQKEFWEESGPILVICYTNHALEQFLNGLKKFSSLNKIVRLGRNSDDLHFADLNYGPEQQLKTFLMERYNISDDDACYYYKDYCYYEEEYKYFLFEDPQRSYEWDFKRLVNYLKRYYTKTSPYTKPRYYLSKFNFVRPELVPLKIMKWFRLKSQMTDMFKHLKNLEDKMDDIKSQIKQVSVNEKNGILTKIINKNDVDYHFEQIEFFCWLLSEDETIFSEQNKEIDGPSEYSAVEQGAIYNLFCNFILEDESSVEYLSVANLKEKAYKLEMDLKLLNEMNYTDLEYLNKQLDLFLKKIDFMNYCLTTDFGLPEVELSSFSDPFMMQSKHRWQIYKHWVETYKNKLRLQLEVLCDNYQTSSDIYNDLKEMDKVKLLKELDIVGMTTTNAARSRSTLEALKSPIIIVEEAAEVLESHIVTALTKDCQHLILLGDHQQLRPKTSDYTIEKRYNLGISLFERMIQNNVECHTLNVQHRMRPQISSLISPLFYKDLLNHKSVEMYPFVSGIDLPLYFIDHMEKEELYGDSSKMNLHEAKFLIQLAIYLLNNDHKPENITILAAYLGQSYILKKEQEKEKSMHPDIGEVRIAVIDNFQGEENEIILLSLVRSNDENKVGFLSTDNRVCVALSRARVGLYIMGNMTQLCKATDIWKSIRSTLESQNAIGMYLPLRCKNHKEHITLVSKATDFVKVPEGGCYRMCRAILECGHTCVKLCHGSDENHEIYRCKEPCTRLLCDDENHKCEKECGDDCDPCHYPVHRKLFCGHETILACSLLLVGYECKELIEKQLNCGHSKNIPCSLKPDTKDVADCKNADKNLLKCVVKTEKIMPECGHTQVVPCFELETFKCQFEMEIILECGHKGNKLCSMKEKNVQCFVPCRSILGCGHECARNCHIDDDPGHHTYKCMKACDKNMKGCNYPETHPKCQLPCYESCLLCKILLRTKSYTSCSHVEKIECFTATQAKRCNRRCSKKLPCGHQCQNKCAEDCGRCKQVTIKKIPECGHKIKTSCSEMPLQENCTKPCAKTLECGHSCTALCNKPCNQVCFKRCGKLLECSHNCIKKCHEMCACKMTVLPVCGHSIAIKCGDEVSPEKCKRSVNKILDCGHMYLVACNQPISDVICNKESLRILACGHTQLDGCNKSIENLKCNKKCQKLLECGHKCTQSCSVACNNQCLARCTKKLECGHPCQARCSQQCTPAKLCLFPCEKLLKCNHKCVKRCYQSCTEPCLENCDNKLQCGHSCTNTCGAECIAVCKAKCGKQLDCGHHCRELCGNPCMEVCKRFCKKTLQCGHRCHKKCFEACDMACKSACEKLLECGHEWSNLCGEQCSETCENRCQRTLKCGHLCKEKCGDPCTPTHQCKNFCKKMLPCEHQQCRKLCNEPCTVCTERCNKKLDCDHICINKCNETCACSIVKSSDCIHYVRVKCGETPSKLNCSQSVCNKIMDCGHNCKQKCNEECKCFESCRKRLKCGCLCIKLTCSEPCECRNRCCMDENEE